MNANPLDLLVGPSNTTWTLSILPYLPNSRSKSLSVVVKLRPNTPRHLEGVGFSLSPYTLVGLGIDLDLLLDLGDLDLGDPDLVRLL